MQSVVMLNVANKPFMPNVTMLSVLAPSFRLARKCKTSVGMDGSNKQASLVYCNINCRQKSIIFSAEKLYDCLS